MSNVKDLCANIQDDEAAWPQGYTWYYLYTNGVLRERRKHLDPSFIHHIIHIGIQERRIREHTEVIRNLSLLLRLNSMASRPTLKYHKLVSRLVYLILNY